VKIEPLADCADANGLAKAVSQAIHDSLLFRADVELAPCGSLPRFEMKARRFVKVSQ